ncbi:MAG: cytochrome ubiquinol oxidase subunit I [Propionibacteriaceae bacterium]|nr:cytochrome ubiquinol oxidase subunit I [Propionibacteriaceae bacterium]
MSPDSLARWQFGITTVYHYLFVPLTISMSVLTAVLQSLWYNTDKDAYLRLTRFFGRLFLINFAMGVVTGIVQEFQFGMGWSEYSRFVGDIFGAPLALEALIAFFLESTFLGIWIFGWDRLSKRVHLLSIWIAAMGTVISSIFIVAANAWMQNPTGAHYDPEQNRATLDSFTEVIANPVFLTQWPHTIATSMMVGSGFMAGIAFYLFVTKARDKAPADDVSAYRTGLRFGSWILIVSGVLTVITGDLLGKEMVVSQPIKMAAAENLLSPEYVGKGGEVGFQIIPGVEVFPGLINVLYGTMIAPDMETILTYQVDTQGYHHWDRTSPNGRWIEGTPLQYGESSVLYLNYGVNDHVPDSYSIAPNVPVAFWSFRLMMGLGFLAGVGGILLLVATDRKKIPQPRKLWTLVCLALPLFPLLGNSFGWIFTEMVRQPWIVNGVMTTAEGHSPFVGTGPALFTLIGFTVLYGVLAVVEVGLLLKYIKMGLPEAEEITIKNDDDELSFAY